MATDTKTRGPFIALFPLGYPNHAAEPATVPALAPPAPEEDQGAHRGDWIGFQIWLTCFLLMAVMIVSELIAGLFRH